ncbi:MAG: cation-transporting P-type ATPase [Blastocatellia bacterium]
MEFWSIASEAVFKKLRTTQQGLSSAVARQRLARFGRNVLRTGQTLCLWERTSSAAMPKASSSCLRRWMPTDAKARRLCFTLTLTPVTKPVSPIRLTKRFGTIASSIFRNTRSWTKRFMTLSANV